MKSLELFEARQRIAVLEDEVRRLNRQVYGLKLRMSVSKPLVQKLHNENVTLKRQLKRRDNTIAAYKVGELRFH